MCKRQYYKYYYLQTPILPEPLPSRNPAGTIRGTHRPGVDFMKLFRPEFTYQNLNSVNYELVNIGFTTS
jgi:hypothetical protein